MLAADLGTGSGALGLALAHHWPDVKMWAIDVSKEALELAQENRDASELAERVTLLESDWFETVPKELRFDLLVANPPYLTSAEVEESSPEVKSHEPAVALSTAEDGMDALRIIIEQAPRFLAKDGLLAMETGIAQHAELSELMVQAGFTKFESKADLAGRHRFVFARWPGETSE